MNEDYGRALIEFRPNCLVNFIANVLYIMNSFQLRLDERID